MKIGTEEAHIHIYYLFIYINHPSSLVCLLKNYFILYIETIILYITYFIARLFVLANDPVYICALTDVVQHW